jgi:hypothetical protein
MPYPISRCARLVVLLGALAATRVIAAEAPFAIDDLYRSARAISDRNPSGRRGVVARRPASPSPGTMPVKPFAMSGSQPREALSRASHAPRRGGGATGGGVSEVTWLDPHRVAYVLGDRLMIRDRRGDGSRTRLEAAGLKRLAASPAGGSWHFSARRACR